MSRKKHGKVDKFIRFGFMALIFALVLTVAINYLPVRTYALEVHDNGYGLQVNQEKVNGRNNHGKLFNISDMAPGDQYTEAITMKNVGSESFQSLISVINTSTQGSLLFDSLNLAIREGSENGKVIFNGKLKDMKNIVLCSLRGSTKKTYFMTLSLPAGSGNEYQSKNAGFKFVITAAANAPAHDGKDSDKNLYKKMKKH